MLRKIIFGSIWLVFIIYTIFIAPTPVPTEILQLLKDLFTANLSGVEPIVAAIFYVMGIFPWMYGAFILVDGSGQKFSVYPFFILSIAFGAYALLPYFALRQSNSSWDASKGRLIKVLDSRLMAIISSFAIVVLLVWGIANGSWSNFIGQWKTDNLVNLMSLDFCILSFLFPAILGDDMKRRGVEENWLFWLATFVPLLGTLVYWCLRPPLPEWTKD